MPQALKTWKAAGKQESCTLFLSKPRKVSHQAKQLSPIVTTENWCRVVSAHVGKHWKTNTPHGMKLTCKNKNAPKWNKFVLWSWFIYRWCDKRQKGYEGIVISLCVYIETHAKSTNEGKKQVGPLQYFSQFSQVSVNSINTVNSVNSINSVNSVNSINSVKSVNSPSPSPSPSIIDHHLSSSIMSHIHVICCSKHSCSEICVLLKDSGGFCWILYMWN